MKLEFYNCPKPEKLDAKILPETPAFVSYEPNFSEMEKYAEKYKNIKNILVIAHGGSVTSSYAFYNALKYQAKKECYFLSTVDPDYIYELKSKLKPEETLVIPISKSGETVTQMEMLSQFVSYPLLFITGKNTPLKAFADKLKVDVVLHPPIGGRYTGMTEVGLLPACIAGLDVVGLFSGAKELYTAYQKENLAWQSASVLFQLEEQGFVDVFMPFYSHNLFASSNLIVQLCHESFGKSGKGQTYFAHEAPESQHHTNQRFFGGRKNICGFFVASGSFLHPTQNNYPVATHSVQLKNHVLFDINKIPLEKALDFELQGTLEDARVSGIPVAHLETSGFSAREIGRFIAFWQLYAVYASVLRNVDPFNQPQVENSKNISFTKRIAFKGLL